MERVCNFLKEAGVYYLATVEGNQPRVRPFGTAHIFEGKLYVQTGKVKPVSKQISKNPKVEICAFRDGEWLRVAGELVNDDRIEAKKSMLDAYENLRGMYNENDDRLVPFEVRREMWIPHVLKTGEKTSYGLGIMTGDFDDDHRTVSDRTELWHTGGADGFISRISYFPDEKISVIMLTNWNGIARDELFCGIVNTF